MREIKFRGWNTISNIMVDEISVFTPQETYNLNDSFNKDMTVLPLQFTGLKDKNGKDIYEGDILDYVIFDCFDNDTRYKGQVVFNNGTFDINECELRWVHSQDDELEVIGNIYENPELLNSNKEMK